MEQFITDAGPAIIAVLVPLAIAGFKVAWAKVPTFMLPIAAAILGPLFDLAIAYVTSLPAQGTAAAALYGLAGVGLREIADQAKKVVTAAP